MVYFIKILNITFTLLLVAKYSAISQEVPCDISNRGNLKTHPNSQITFFGNLENTNTGNITEEGGRVSFTNPNTSLRVFGENVPVFSELFVNVKDNLIVDVAVNVTTGLFFEEGIIITPRNTPNTSINLLSDALNANEADLRHVDGYLSYTGNEAYTFPVGDDNRLRSLSIVENASVNTSKAAYFFDNASSPLEFPLNLPFEEKPETISNISRAEFWDLDGEQPTSVTLTWDILSNISQILDSENLEELIVVGWSKSEQQWISLGNVGTTGNFNQGSITSQVFIPNDFEAITFARNIPEDTSTELFVFNGISPGDNNAANDFLVIKNISLFPNNNLKIFNRWGVKVYEANGYDADQGVAEPNNAFRGQSNGRITLKKNDLLPVGTYYYVLEYETGVQGRKKTLAGYLYINR